MATFPQVGLMAVLDVTGFNRGAQVMRDTLGGISKDLDETEESSAGAGGALDMLGGVASGVATGGLTILIGAVAAVGTALVGTATAGLKFATEFGGVMKTVEAQTGATGAELENFRNITEEVYQTGLGESFADVAQAMVQVEQMTGAAGEELQALTTSALTMSEVFDVDVAESVRAVDQAMIAFGAEGTDVFDMMTATIQATGDPMDDLADTINEYSSNFADAGFSAEEMFAVLNAGLEAGAWNFDKVGDTVREFFIRIQDGSDTTAEALTELFAAPGDEVDVLQDRIEELNVRLEEQEVAVNEARWAMEEAEGAWGAAQDVVKELEGALNAARMELKELAHPELAGMAEFDDQIFDLEQSVKKARLAMLDMEKDTPEFEAAKDNLDGMNKELDKMRLAKDIQFEAQLRDIEKAVEAGITDAVTYEEAIAQIGAKKGEIAGLEGALWNAQAAEAAAAAEAAEMNHQYELVSEHYAMIEETIADATAALEEAGTPAQEFLAELESGAITGPEAMSKVIQALKDVDDQVKQNEIGAALFGSHWEDLGPNVVLAMDPAEAALLAFEGATGRAQGAISAGLGPAWEKLKRVLQVALADGFAPVLAMLVENITPAFEAFATWLKGDGKAVLERFGKLITDNLAPALEKLGPFIEKKVIPALEQFADWMIKEGFPAVQKFINWLVKKGIPGFKNFIDFIVKKVIPALDKLIHPFRPIKKAIDEAKEKFESITETLGDAVEAAIDWATDFPREISTALAGAIKAVIDWGREFLKKIGTILGDAVQAVIDWGVDLLRELGTILGNWISDLLTWGKEFIRELGTILGDAVQAVIDWGVDLLRELGTILAGWISDLITWGGEFIKELGTILGDAVQAVIDWGVDLLRELGTILGNWISDLITWGGEFIAELGTILGDAVQAVIDWGTELLTELGTILGNWISDLITWGGEFIRELGTILSNAVQAVLDFAGEFLAAAQTLMQSFIDGITGAAESVTTALSDVVGGAIDSLQSAVEIGGALGNQLLTIGGLIIGRITEAVVEHGPEVQTALEDAVQFASDQLAILLSGQGSIVQRLLEVGGNIVNRIMDGLGVIIGVDNPLYIKLKELVDNAATTLKDKITDVEGFFNAGWEIVKEIARGITNKAGEIWNALCEAVNDAFGFLPGDPRPFNCGGGQNTNQASNSIASATNFIGQSMVAGMAQGIYDGSHWVAQAAVWTVHNAMLAAQRAAGVHSPSSLFAGLGVDLMAGLQMGIAAKVPAISAQISAAVTAPALGMVQAPVLSSGATVTNNFHVGGNTIHNDVDGAIFEARVMNVIQRNLGGAGGGLL